MINIQESNQHVQDLYPSVDLAYPLAVASYETAQKRFDALNDRLQTLLTFAATATLGIIAFAGSKNINFGSRFFQLALVACIAGLGLATYARVTGSLILLNPKILYENYLTDSEWEFKKNTIYWAGENFEHNNKAILLKSKLVAISALLFFVETVFLAVWVMDAL